MEKKKIIFAVISVLVIAGAAIGIFLAIHFTTGGEKQNSKKLSLFYRLIKILGLAEWLNSDLKVPNLFEVKFEIQVSRKAFSRFENYVFEINDFSQKFYTKSV